MAGRGVDIKLGGATATREEADEVRALGGLFVLGTERHEARRIDNQLRGRAGRQGDPGVTQFYVSLDDDLMRIFGAERIKNMMGKFGFPEDQPIENKIINRSLESAQEKIEGFNFDARKYTLEYDDVMNHQRQAVYERRRAMLYSDRAKIEEYLDEFVGEDETMQKTIADRRAAVGDDAFFEAVRRIMLYVTDVLWVEHLETMEYTRSSVNLRAYGQREPLVEYKKEGLRLFREMEAAYRAQVLSLVATISNEIKTAPTETANQQILLATHQEPEIFAGGEPNSSSKPQVKPVIIENSMPKAGRNDPCPCGSDKKYKKCHGA